MIRKIHCIHFHQIDSTNNWAKANYEKFDPADITLVSADYQTAGRGRFDRIWVSPPKENIYATFTIFIENKQKNLGNIPQILALSCLSALQTFGFDLKIKWPNDLLLDGKKIGGILTETISCKDQIVVFLGIGVNINMPPETLQKIDRPAASLFSVSGKLFSVNEVLHQLVKFFLRDFEIYLIEDFQAFFPAYQNHLIHPPHSKIRFHDNQRIWEGEFLHISPKGSLWIRLPSGEIKECICGELLETDSFLL